MARRLRWTLAAAGLTATVLTTAVVITASTRHVTTMAAAQPLPPPSSSAAEPPTSATPTPTPTTPTTPATPLPDPAAVADDVADAVDAASKGTKVGLEVYDTKTGKTLALTDAETPFYTASVVKLLIALDSLYDDGTWQVPEGSTADDLTDMIAGSDDAIASKLWEADGGTAIVGRMADLIGLSHTIEPTDPGEWGMTKMSPSDVVTTYRYLTDTVPDATAQPLLTAMADARQPADDGYPQYFGIPDGLPGATWEIKQGWMILRSALVLNTTGLVDSRYVVVLMTQQPAATSSAKGRAAVTAGVKALAPALAAWTAD
ncbi:hypothetical protein VSH64_15215 [Amycolatopsis rhabdoformis]|uniref:Serine hydrolase n=1 Tax=Amycolatopsis rhabdoformis TaxID=1448059 RepID=A0ABZ1II50_9PSEU|nr:hypothetical protein [Amycolatopsis rhabdoformis]WSE33446.1 hypothetical protein VSH64_15215 [Amycolatopsis rhabdoformis]